MVILATDPLIKSRKRRRLVVRRDGTSLRRRAPYIEGEKLDDLFLPNIRAFARMGFTGN
jgi:hypothetical protein